VETVENSLRSFGKKASACETECGKPNRFAQPGGNIPGSPGVRNWFFVPDEASAADAARKTEKKQRFLQPLSTV
jgi:hypothetical protein